MVYIQLRQADDGIIPAIQPQLHTDNCMRQTSCFFPQIQNVHSAYNTPHTVVVCATAKTSASNAVQKVALTSPSMDSYSRYATSSNGLVSCCVYLVLGLYVCRLCHDQCLGVWLPVCLCVRVRACLCERRRVLCRRVVCACVCVCLRVCVLCHARHHMLGPAKPGVFLRHE